ncbi:MAG: flagellin lysine-N-methylase, partial [Butyrivibrio sp.]
MKITVPDYYDKFKCIAGDCDDTCCAGWQVDVDDASYAYYRTVTGPFGERLRSVMIDGTNGQEGQFRIREDGRCPFLNDCGLCDLYAELGEEALCVTCDQYPRYTCDFGNFRETGIALSCKTAAELILADNRTPGFTHSENDESFSQLNNIDGLLYINLKKAREKAFEIIWDRKFSVWERMVQLLEYSNGLQKLIKKPDKIPEYITGFEPKNTIKIRKPEPEKEIQYYRAVWKCYMKQIIIKKEWPKLARTVDKYLYTGEYLKNIEDFGKYYADREYEFENLITYFIFRYFMKAVFDGDVLTKVKM